MKKNNILLLCLLYTFVCSAQVFTTPPFSNNTKTGVLSILGIDVKIKEGIAITTLDMQFGSSGDQWQDEGIVEFSLMPHQHISQFKLDVNGKLRDAVVVERQKGKAAYEKIISKRVDPGLLEMTGYNSYRLRVYPIFHNQYKRAVVTYEEKLQKSEGSYLYNLPLKYNLPLGNNYPKNTKLSPQFTVNLSIDNSNEMPIITESPFKDFLFIKKSSTFEASAELEIIPTGILSLSIPIKNNKTELLLEKPKVGTDRAFLISINPNIEPEAKVLPHKVALYLDNSLSMQSVNTNLLDLLRSYIYKIGNLSVEMYSVNNEVKKVGIFNIQNGNSTELIQQIALTKYGEVCNFDTLDFNKPGYDEIWFISDGNLNGLSKPILKVGEIPVLVFNYKEQANDIALAKIAETSGGVYLNLTKPISDPLKWLMTKTLHLISMDYSPKQISEIYSQSFQNTEKDKTYTITGLQKKNNAELILNFGKGNSVSYSDTIILPNSETDKYNGFVERYWINNKIKYINATETNNLKETTGIGMQFGILTPNTSLIVLETIEDYVTYEIIPPTDELQKEYFSNMERIAEEEHEKKLEKEVELKEQFTDRKKIWIAFSSEKDIKKVDTYLIRRANRRQRAEERKERWLEGLEQAQREQRAREYREWELEFGRGYRSRRQSSRYRGSITQSGEDLTPATKNTITGIITDGGGDPVIAALILIDGTTNMVVTDIDGKFTIELPDNKPTLEIRSLGFKSVKLKPSKKTVKIVMEEETLLEEVVITGYGDFSSSDEPAPVAITKEPANQKNEINMHETEYYPIINDSIYLDEMKNLSPQDTYKKYQEIKNQYVDKPFFYISVADLLYRKGDNNAAYKVISNLAEMSSANPLLIPPCAKFILQLGYTEEAVNMFEANLWRYPAYLSSYRDLGLAYAAAKRYQDAINTMYSALEQKFESQDLVMLLTDMNAIIAKAIRAGVKLKLGNIESKFIYPITAAKRFVLGTYSDSKVLMEIKDGLGHNSFNYRYADKGGITSNSLSSSHAPIDFVVKNISKGSFDIMIKNNSYDRTKKGLGYIAYLEVYTDFGTDQEKKEIIYFQSSQENPLDYNKFIIPSE